MGKIDLAIYVSEAAAMCDPVMNHQLVDLFPFLLPRKLWTDEIPSTYDYTYTLLDAMNDGWRKAFGWKFINDLKAAIIKDSGEEGLYKARISDIKEKWGFLHVYMNNKPGDRVDRVLGKYASESKKYCIKCGKPAKWVSLGWISPWCDECAKRVKMCDTLIPFEDWKRGN